MFSRMADDNHIPFRDAAISVSCPCRRWPTYYDAADMRAFLLSKRWPPTLATVRERFLCKDCGRRPATRVVGPLTKVTRLMSERVEMARDYETIGEKMARQKADDAAKGSGGAN